ncbi:MAG: S8 family peptidase [Bacteriovoracaceae bacterium]
MKKYIILLTSIALVGCSQDIKKSSAPATFGNGQVITNQINMKGDLQAAKSHLKSNGITIKKTETVDSSENIHSIEIEPVAEEKSTLLIKELEEKASIEFAEFGYRVHSNQLPKDRFTLQQWGLFNQGQDLPMGIQGKKGADIKVAEAWAISKGSKEIIVGVIDSGIDYKHPDLKGNMWINEAEKNGMAGIDDDGNGYTDDVFGWNFVSEGQKNYYGNPGTPDPMDDNDHGTHCAGVIGATTNNFQGISGINWNVRLMALKFLNKDGSGSTLDAYRAIVYGTKNGAHVLSNSWGGGGESKLLKHAIQKAEEAGVLFVAAAGNDSANNDSAPSYPASYEVESVISVAASDGQDNLAYFSNYGVNSVHLSAPGTSILSSVSTKVHPDLAEPYMSFSGTSMATPHVAGVAALVLAHDASLRGNPIALKKRLLGTVDYIPSLVGRVSTSGRLNAARALKGDMNAEIAEGEPKFISQSVVMPSFPNEMVDKTWTFTHPGAKKIRLKFSKTMIDVGYDLLAIYDKNHKLIQKMDELMVGDFYSAWIDGDKASLRFANALVIDSDFFAGTESEPYANNKSEGFEILGYEVVE